MTLEELEVVISANAKQFNSQVAQVQSKVDSMATKVNSSVNNMSGSFDKLGKVIAGAFAIGVIAKFTKSCLDLGSNLTEVQNVVDVTYGSMNTKVNEFAKNAWKTVGLSETMAKQYMGNFGAMSKSMGFTVSKAEEMAETLTNLSGDVASFYNIEQSEAYTKLKSVFTGETETLKELGVVMTQENLNQYALANGYGKTTERMNQQEKVALRLAYVTETLSAANGDFARTSNTWANQVRLLTLQYQSLKAHIGQGLIAVLTPVINVINTIMSKLVTMASTFNSVLSSIGFNISNGGSTSGVGSTADAMNSLSNATDGVGKSADKAKKKVDALMSIDEINKVGSNNSGSSGSGGVTSIASPAIDTSATEESLNALNEKVNKILAELLSPLRKAWDNYGSWFLSKWEYFKKAFGYSCDELKSFLIGIWNNGGKEFVQRLGEIGIAIGGVALQIGGEILVALGRLWNHLNPENNPYTRKFINAMNSLAIAVRDFVISAGNWFSKFLDLGGQAFINVIGDIVVLIGTTLAKIMRDAINFITAFMNSWAGSSVIGAVAMALNIVAGVIKAVMIVIEKCRYVLEGLIILWSIWKIQNTAGTLLITENAVSMLVGKLTGLATSLMMQITLCKEWYKQLALNCIDGIKKLSSYITGTLIPKMATLSTSIITSTKSFISWAKVIILHPVDSMKYLIASIKVTISNLSLQAKQLAVNTINWVKNTAGLIASKVATIATTVAQKGLTVAQLALNIAMKACPILLIISGITALIVVVKKIGDKFGWWTNISNVLGKVMGWVSDKVGWLWGKIAGFFGWDEEPEVKENLEEVGAVAEEVAKTTDDAFGTATSNVNKYLDSIHFNATRLAEEVDEATKAATEKFGMLSKSCQEYLDAVATHNQDKLNEMSVSQSVYNEEIKAMYADLTEAEKNEFMKKYGIIKGINDEMLNYEGLKYDERVARHAAYLETIENDETLSYQEKKIKLDQSNAEFQKSIDDEVERYRTSIKDKREALEQFLNTHGNTTEQGIAFEKSLRDEIEADRKHIEEITKSSYDSQVSTVEEATGAMKQANEDNATTQEDTYKNLTAVVDESMETINKSLEGARTNISSFSNDASELGDELRNSFDGIGGKISFEFIKAGFTISSVLGNVASIYKSASDKVSTITNDMVSNLSNGTIAIKNSFINTFSDVRSTIATNMENAYRDVVSAIEKIKNLFNNFDATLKVKIPHFYMEGNFNAETKEVPKVGVNYFAKGGVVDRATLGIVGEAGKEAIVPLENNTRGLDLLADKLFSRMPTSTSDNSNDGDLILMIDGDVIGKVALNNIKKMQRQGGLTLIPT